MERNFDFLLDRMKNSRPVLLLGAGFSVGAVNGDGNPLPVGKKLSNSLYDYFFADGARIGLDDEMLKEIEETKDNLKEVCTYLRLLGKQEDRNIYLTQTFQNCSAAPGGFHHKLTDYGWEYIFTLNIDDLVENIYREAGIDLSVWDRSHPSGSGRSNTTNLVKLHGSVGDAGSGYVFDEEEYRGFSIDGSSLLKEFAHQALQHDLVLVGTQFQEDDLQLILDIYEQSGYSNAPFYRFFILPGLSGKLRLQIQNGSNNVWIKGDTETFLKRLDKGITIPNREKSRLREKGTVFLDEISRSTPSSFDLYKGCQTIYPDFFHNADILSRELPTWKRDALSTKPRMLMALFGESYVGKTCFAKRLLVELSEEGYTAFQLNRLDDDVFDLISSYLQTLPEKSKVALYADNASYYYDRFLKIKEACPNSVEKLVIILEDTIENHRGKEYLLLDDPDSNLYPITSKMDHTYAQSIFETLSRNKRLNKYLGFLPKRVNPFSRKAKEIIIPKIEQENDIIDALYYSSEGEPFQRHYERWLKKRASDTEKKLLTSLCYLYRLGITSIPSLLIAKLGRSYDGSFRQNDFLAKYSDVLSIQGGWVRLHRARILNDLIGEDNSDLVINTLRMTTVYSTPVDEKAHNDITAVFERSIRVRRIRSTRLLPKLEILELLKGLEDSCDHISYFWIQYGIAAQINDKFEDAANHFRYAQSIRPNSYHVNHALAKNELEWGLHLIKTKTGDGKSRFLHGSDMMYEITQDGKFSKNYRYSVHTYVEMWMEYAKVTGTVLQEDICKNCAKLLKELLDRRLDDALTDLIKGFIRYCRKNGMSDFISELRL